MNDMEYIRMEASRLLHKITPDGVYPQVHIHPVKYGYFTLDPGDGVTPTCAAKAPEFVKWLSSDNAAWEAFKDICWKKSGKSPMAQMGLGLDLPQPKKRYDDHQ